ncbi:MAG: sigma-70 family RNA polymerase sigma factor [Myxococcaceae bacterium]
MLNSAGVSPLNAAVERRDDALVAARPQLEALARRLVWDTEDARDVVQGALVEAIDHWDRLSDEGARGAWLRRIVVNRAFSHLRRRRFWNRVGALLGVREDEVAPGPDESFEQREHQRRLAAALETLPVRQAMAFSLRYLEGWSLDDVAASMGIDRGTVRIHVQRAVAALRDLEVLT